MKHKFEDFIDDVKTTHGDNLSSIILYGSAAAGDYVPGESDYNILIALHSIRPIDLRNAHAYIREWNRVGHPIPVYFTVSELKTAGDVFPIELHQMETARKVLFGEDVLANIEINDKNLRHQIEFELRSNLIKLRRRYIHASCSVDDLMELMSKSVASFFALFSATLVLVGSSPPDTKQKILEKMVVVFGLNPNPFEKILNFRENKVSAQLDEVSANELFGTYIEQIEKIISAIDQMDRT